MRLKSINKGLGSKCLWKTKPGKLKVNLRQVFLLVLLLKGFWIISWNYRIFRLKCITTEKICIIKIEAFIRGRFYFWFIHYKITKIGNYSLSGNLFFLKHYSLIKGICFKNQFCQLLTHPYWVYLRY